MRVPLSLGLRPKGKAKSTRMLFLLHSLGDCLKQCPHNNLRWGCCRVVVRTLFATLFSSPSPMMRLFSHPPMRFLGVQVNLRHYHGNRDTMTSKESRGASEARPAPPLPQVALGSTGGAGVRSWLLQLLLEQHPLWLHIREELAAEKGESGASGDRPAAARGSMFLQPREVER